MTTYSESRRVLRVTGRELHAFLQGLVTSDVARVNDGPVYTGLLTPQGKLIADFFLAPEGEAILLDVAADVAAGLVQRLTMYKLRADVTIEETALCVSRGTGAAPEAAFADPRDPVLGWRLIAEDALPEDGTDWDALHVAACVPRWGRELGPDSYILEMGFERMGGVDFKKGCYVGQEVTARMKHKTELRKGLTRVGIDGAAPVGTEITANGKPVGVIGTQANNQALAYLRFDRMGPQMQAGDAVVSPLA